MPYNVLRVGAYPEGCVYTLLWAGLFFNYFNYLFMIFTNI